ncbi:SpvB/TcaC N-terminal domain-containing protein [Marinicella litoralis]|uniref:RHS repeat-associated protein n=1 Tax=Marinicella litoralis TaxID=644220 RepID=A0A4R6XV84_9GAMM|nr:SpvB/TcaC N-terminal domain-containing protein [Marinicella litoralis]TDR23746.1 RHS repeat-associated protein [Marinicella litoralis]
MYQIFHYKTLLITTLLLLSGLSSAEPIDQVCGAVPNNKSSVVDALLPGRYTNPEREGQGFDFWWMCQNNETGSMNKNSRKSPYNKSGSWVGCESDQHYVLTPFWYTYDSALTSEHPKPIWFLGIGEVIMDPADLTKPKYWEGEAYQLTYDEFENWSWDSNPVMDMSQSVAELKIRIHDFAGTSNQTIRHGVEFSMNENYDPVCEAGNPECHKVECVQYAAQENGVLQGQSQVFNGVYSEENSKDWILNVSATKVTNGPDLEHTIAMFFDQQNEQGIPRWVIMQNCRDNASCNEVNTELEEYLDGLSYAGVYDMNFDSKWQLHPTQYDFCATGNNEFCSSPTNGFEDLFVSEVTQGIKAYHSYADSGNPNYNVSAVTQKIGKTRRSYFHEASTSLERGGRRAELITEFYPTFGDENTSQLMSYGLTNGNQLRQSGTQLIRRSSSDEIFMDGQLPFDDCFHSSGANKIKCDLTLHWFADGPYPFASVYATKGSESILISRERRSPASSGLRLNPGVELDGWEFSLRSNSNYNSSLLLNKTLPFDKTTPNSCTAPDSAPVWQLPAGGVVSPHNVALQFNTPPSGNLDMLFKIYKSDYDYETNVNGSYRLIEIASHAKSSNLQLSSLQNYLGENLSETALFGDYDSNTRFRFDVYYRNNCGLSGRSQTDFSLAVPIVADQAVVNLAVPAHQPGSGPLPGSGGVSGGSAHYSLPIQVAPGRQGMQPSVSVNYSSKGGNGPLGVGWSLSAGSSIYRCPSTLAQDGKNHAVVFDKSTDKLCLDGQRLMVVSGTYGASLSEYRTEMDSFNKIRLIGDMDGATPRFEVLAKSGIKSIYDYRVKPHGTNKALSWNLSTQVDKHGNSIRYNYANRGSGEVVLFNINYTGQFVNNVYQTGNRNLVFTYEDRGFDYSSSFRYGTRTQQTQKLTTIDVYVEAELKRKYVFDYQKSNATSRLQLNSIIEYPTKDTSNNGRVLLVNSWTDANNWIGGKPKMKLYKRGIPEEAQLIDPPIGQEPSQNSVFNGGQRIVADYDGDGIKEVLTKYKDTNGQSVTELHSYRMSFDAQGNKQPELKGRINIEGFSSDSAYGFVGNNSSADFNNDGRTDVIYQGAPIKSGMAHPVMLALWNQPGYIDTDLNTPQNLQDIFQILDTHIMLGKESVIKTTDLDLDGDTDLVVKNLSIEGEFVHVEYYINESILPQSEGGSLEPTFSRNLVDLPEFESGSNFSVDDLNGDGVSDLIIKNRSNKITSVAIGQIQNNAFNFDVQAPSSIGLPADTTHVFHMFTDVNGDGLNDYIYTDYISASWRWVIKLNQGGTKMFTGTPINTGSSATLPADLNCRNPMNGGPGNGVVTDHACSPAISKGMKVVDIDNDGIAEILLPQPDEVVISSCQFFFVGSDTDPIDKLMCSDPNLVNGADESYYNYENPRPNWDAGTYEYQALDFKTTINGGITIEVKTNIGLFDSPQSYVGNYGDYLGDGLQDHNTTFGCEYLFDATRPCLTGVSTDNQNFNEFLIDYYFADNVFDIPGLTDELESNRIPVISINQSMMPDMVYKVDKPGKHDWIEWDYLPLSTDASVRPALPLYQVKAQNRYVEEDELKGDHFYFNSSMYVVAESRQSNGVVQDDSEDAYNTTQYGYEEAVYNNKGRGFQGFRKICIDDLTAETHSESLFHQVFPVAGKLERVTTYPVGVDYTSTSHRMAEDRFIWGDGDANTDENISLYANKGVHFIPMIRSNARVWENGIKVSQVKTFNGDGGESSNTANRCTDFGINNSGFDGYGNNLCQTKWSRDFLNGVNYQQRYSTAQNEFYSVNTSDWWVDQLKASHVDSEVTYLSNDWTLPSSVSGVDFNDQSSQSSYYFWNADRTINCQFSQSGADVAPASCNNAPAVSKTVFDGYDQHGNPLVVKTQGKDSSVIKELQTTYEPEGYFPEVITQVVEPGNVDSYHMASSTYDRYTGQVLAAVDPNGMAATSTTDVYGMIKKQEVEDLMGDVVGQASNMGMRFCDNLCTTYQDALNKITNRVRIDYGSQLPAAEFPKNALRYYSFAVKNGAAIIKTFYDAAGRTVLVSSQQSDKISLTATLYNAKGQVEVETQPFGYVGGQIVLDAGANGTMPFATLYDYDIRGRVSRKVIRSNHLRGPINPGTGLCHLTTDYNHNGGLTDINAGYNRFDSKCIAANNEPNNLLMLRVYDSAQRLMMTEDVYGTRVNYWYDANGNPSVIEDGDRSGNNDGNLIVATYDDLSRKVKVNDPNLGVQLFSYNGFGEVIQSQDQKQINANLYDFSSYDALGRVLVKYSNVNSNKQPVGWALSYKDINDYDTVDWVAGWVESSYGNLLRSTRFSNQQPDVVEYGSTFYKAHRNRYVHDDVIKTRLVQMDRKMWNTVNDYASQSQSTPDGTNAYSNQVFSTQYLWDDNHNRIKQTNYAGGLSVQSVYNNFGVLNKQIDPLTGEVLLRVDNVDMNYRGQPTKQYHGVLAGQSAAITEHKYYSSTGQVASINHLTSSGNDLQLTYQYDPWGNLNHRQHDSNDSTATEVLIYDRLHRLTSTQIGSQSPTTYGYDALGNLTRKSDYSYHNNANAYVYGEYTNPSLTCGGTSPAQPGPNAVSEVQVDQAGFHQYFYDANGNRTYKCRRQVNLGDNYYSFISHNVYDSNNLLIQAKQKAAGVNRVAQRMNFRYGSDNQRYYKYDAASSEITLYGGKDYERVYNLISGEIQNKYYLTDYLVVTRYEHRDQENHYLQKDRLGSTVQVVNNEGEMLHRLSYDAFGKPRNADWSKRGSGDNGAVLNFTDADNLAGTRITKRGFTQHEHLDSLQLIHMNGRMYDFHVGRFLSVDPFIQGVDSQALNPYSYIQNNPLSGTDPSGYKIEKERITGSHIATDKAAGPSGSGALGRAPADFKGKVALENGGDSATPKGAETSSSGGNSDVGSQSKVSEPETVPHDNFTPNSESHPYENGEYRYNSEDETYHHYDEYSNGFCYWGANNCTAEIRDDVLSKYSRPTYKLMPKDAASPDEIVDAHYSGLLGDINDPDAYTKVIGPIKQQKLGEGIYRNITLKGHEMHPGEIIRKWVNINGVAHIRTHGVGLNKSENFLRNDMKTWFLGRQIEKFKASKNDELGPKAFQTMDREAFKYWSNKYGNK